MNTTHVERVAVFYAPAPAHRVKVGRIALKRRQILFEYDPGFVEHVRKAVRRFRRFADQAGVPARLRDTTARALGLPKR